ncbi:hypothetical protein ES708_08614 [subsurface metagenome]
MLHFGHGGELFAPRLDFPRFLRFYVLPCGLEGWPGFLKYRQDSFFGQLGCHAEGDAFIRCDPELLCRPLPRFFGSEAWNHGRRRNSVQHKPFRGRRKSSRSINHKSGRRFGFYSGCHFPSLKMTCSPVFGLVAVGYSGIVCGAGAGTTGFGKILPVVSRYSSNS